MGLISSRPCTSALATVIFTEATVTYYVVYKFLILIISIRLRSII